MSQPHLARSPASLRASEIIQMAVAYGGVFGGTDAGGDAGGDAGEGAGSEEVSAGDILSEVDPKEAAAARGQPSYDADKVFGAPEETRSESGAKVKGRHIKLVTPQSDESGAGAGGTKAAGANPYEEMLAEFDKELTSYQPQTEEPQIKLPEGVPPEVAKAVETLGGQTKQLKEQVSQATQVAQQWQQRAQQVEQWAAQQAQSTQTQIAKLEATVAALQATQRAPAKNADPLDDLKHDWMEEARQKIWEPERQKYEDRIAAIEQGQQKRDQEAQQKHYQAQFEQESTQAAKDVVLKGLPPAVQERFAPTMGAAILSHALFTNSKIPDAARVVRESYLRFAVELMRNKGTVTKDALAKGRKEAPPGTGALSGRGSGGTEPSGEDIVADGRFRDELAWEMAGRPPLRRRKV